MKSLTCHPADDTQYRREGTAYLALAPGICGSPYRVGMALACRGSLFSLPFREQFLAIPCQPRGVLRCEPRHSFTFTVQLPPGFANPVDLPVIVPNASDLGPQDRLSLLTRRGLARIDPHREPRIIAALPAELLCNSPAG